MYHCAGVDPTSGLRQFAGQKNMLDRFHTVALGQGQGPVAIQHINEAVRAHSNSEIFSFGINPIFLLGSCSLLASTPKR